MGRSATQAWASTIVIISSCTGSSQLEKESQEEMKTTTSQPGSHQLLVRLWVQQHLAIGGRVDAARLHSALALIVGAL